MRTSLKKIVALSAAVGLVTMNAASFMANAAGINGMTASAVAGTLTLTMPAGTTALTTGQYAVVTVLQPNGTAVDIGTAGASVKFGNDTTPTVAPNGTALKLTASAPATLAGDTIVITDANILVNVGYRVVVQTYTAGNLAIDYGAAVAVNGTANQVTVTAYVEPILSMSLSSATAQFGSITSDVLNATPTTTVTLSTNAVGGAKLFANNSDSVGAGDGFSNGTVEIAKAAGNLTDLSIGGTYGYGIKVQNDTIAAGTSVGGFTSTTPTAVAAFGALAAATTFTPIVNTAAQIAGVAGPTNGSAVTVQYGVKVSPLQPAGNYSDTVTYTVTGTF